MTEKIQGASHNVAMQQVKALPKKDEKEQIVIFVNNSATETQQTNNKELKVSDFDFTKFKKSDREGASTKARDTMNEIKDLVRSYNADFPARNYSINYSNFPKPEDYNPKNLGGKEEAFNAWKNDVDSWKEDIKQDLAQLKSTNMNHLLKQQAEALVQLYTQLGYTRDVVVNCLEKNNYDIHKTKNELEELIQTKTNDIKRNTNANAGALKDELQNSEENLHNHLHNESDRSRRANRQEHNFTRAVTRREGLATRNEVEAEAEVTREEVKNDGDKTRAEINKLKQEIQDKMSKKNVPPQRLRDLIKKFNGVLIDISLLPLDILKKILEVI